MHANGRVFLKAAPDVVVSFDDRWQRLDWALLAVRSGKQAFSHFPGFFWVATELALIKHLDSFSTGHGSDGSRRGCFHYRPKETPVRCLINISHGGYSHRYTYPEDRQAHIRKQPILLFESFDP